MTSFPSAPSTAASELLDEGGADEDAMKLIRTSAYNASARLQFARGFGAPVRHMQIDTGDAETVATAFMKNEAGIHLVRWSRLPAQEQGKAASEPDPRQCLHPRGGGAAELKDVETNANFV